MSKLASVKRAFYSVGFEIKRNSPAILVGVGIVGFVGTVALAYHARPKVEKIVEDIEEKRENDEPVNNLEVAKDLGKVLALPAVVGVASIGCVVWAYSIQKNRILTLAGALATAKATQEAFEHKFKKRFGEEAYNELMSVEENTVKDENGDDKIIKTRVNLNSNLCEWYDKSEHYVSDDHTYNMAYIDEVIRILDMRLFAKGYLLLNEVREELGFERTRAGALLGWTASDFLNIEKVVILIEDPKTGQFKNEIMIKWNPGYIYDNMEFGRTTFDN